MRLFPRPYEGLYPAFPVPDIPASPLFALQFGPWTVPVATAGPIAWSLLMRSNPNASVFRPAWRLSSTLAALSLLGSATLLSVVDYADRKGTKAFLEEQGIDVTPAKYSDHFGTLDRDDFLIAGAAIGFLIASSVPRPWSVTGWRRWLGAASFGCAASAAFHDVRAVYKNYTPETIARAKQRKAEYDKIMPQKTAAIRKIWRIQTIQAEAEITELPPRATEKFGFDR